MKVYKNFIFVKWILFIKILFISYYCLAVNSLTITLDPWFNSLNPNTTVSVEGGFVANQIFEPLMRIKPDGSIAGCLISRCSEIDLFKKNAHCIAQIPHFHIYAA